MLIITLVALLALLDRLCGGWPKVPGRGIYYAAPILALFGYIVADNVITAALLALGFIVWREPAWRLIPGASLAPHRHELVPTFIRHCLALAFVPALRAINCTAASEVTSDIAFMLVFAALATGLGFINRIAANQGRDINGWIEAARGATLGVCLWLASA